MRAAIFGQRVSGMEAEGSFIPNKACQFARPNKILFGEPSYNIDAAPINIGVPAAFGAGCVQLMAALVVVGM